MGVAAVGIGGAVGYGASRLRKTPEKETSIIPTIFVDSIVFMYNKANLRLWYINYMNW